MRGTKNRKEAERAMAETFAAFLRGINVNGNKIKMDALKEAFAGMGFADARTVLNTGNVVFTVGAAPAGEARAQLDRHAYAAPPLWNDGTIPDLKRSIESGLKIVFGYDAPVYLRTASELEALRDASRAIPVPEGCHLYLLLCGDASLPAELGELFAAAAHGANERLHPAAGDAFWIVPKGETLSSVFGAKVLGAKRYQNRLTSRNWNTVEKILGLMRAGSPS